MIIRLLSIGQNLVKSRKDVHGETLRPSFLRTKRVFQTNTVSSRLRI